MKLNRIFKNFGLLSFFSFFMLIGLFFWKQKIALSDNCMSKFILFWNFNQARLNSTTATTAADIVLAEKKIIFKKIQVWPGRRKIVNKKC